MAPRPEGPATSCSGPAAGVESIDEKNLVLEHVCVMFRHGDRSPISRNISSKVKMTQSQTDFWISRLAELSVVGALNSGTRVVNYHKGHCREDCCFGQHFDVPPPPQQGGSWPCGQLTAKGIDMMRAKGQKLRESYNVLLQDIQDPVQQVYVQSTNIRRTIRSAQSLLVGLFPEYFVNVDADNSLMVKDTLQPDSRRFLQSIQANKIMKKDEQFVIHADDSNHLAPQHSYELYKDLGKMLANELRKNAPPEFAEASQKISEIIGAGSSKKVAWTGCKLLTKTLGVGLDYSSYFLAFCVVVEVREVLVCYQAHGLQFPEGLNQQLFARICEYDAWLWHHLYGNMDFCRVSFKPGVQRIYSYLTDVTQGVSKHKLSLFSAHDNSLVAIVNALQLQVPRVIPPYGAMLTFEVFRHRTTAEFYVKVLFEGVEVTFAGHEHSALCPFSVFTQAAQSFLQVGAAL